MYASNPPPSPTQTHGGPSHGPKQPRRNLNPLQTREFSGPFPFFRKPSIIGYFSMDENREFVNDRSRLKFLPDYGHRDVRVSLDLNAGMDHVRRKDEERCQDEKLSSVQRWILLHKDRFAVAPDRPMDTLSTDFVCYRGLLTALACAPFERKDGLRMRAIKWRGTIYLHKEETAEKQQQRRNATQRDKVMCSWGYKFEDYVLADNPEDKSMSGSTDGVCEPEEFCCVFRTRIGGHSLVYGAEMDGVDANTEKDINKVDLNTATFAELKTSREITHPGQERTFARFKALKWWAQCFIVGIDRVLCGFRDDEGTVHTLSTYRVADLPRRGREHWQSNVCANFLEAALGFVKGRMEGVADGRLVEFEWEPRQRMEGVASKEVGVSDEEMRLYMPAWYKEGLF